MGLRNGAAIADREAPRSRLPHQSRAFVAGLHHLSQSQQYLVNLLFHECSR